MGNRIELVQSFLSRHRGVVEIDGVSVVVTDWGMVDALLKTTPWYGVDLRPIPGESQLLKLGDREIGQAWVPPCAVFTFRGLEGETIATLQIWIDEPRVELNPEFEALGFVEEIVDAFVSYP